jgi:hypothetical protein
MFFRSRNFVSVFVVLTLALSLVMTSCAPSVTPAPPSIQSPEPSSAPPATPPAPPEPPPPPLAELNLVVEPVAEKRLDVELVYSGGDLPGLCYLGGYAMLAKFNDSDIDFTDVVANSGIGSSALYIPEVNILNDGSFLQSIGLAAKNQGFDYYIAALKAATITDTFLAADFPKDAKQVLSAESEDEAFELLKRLVSSDIPVMVHVDLSPIKEPMVAHTSWAKYAFMGADHLDHYMTVTGYDQNVVYLSDPTEKAAGKGEDIPVDITGFLSAWENGDHPSFGDAGVGPYWMLFLGKRGTARSASELISWNKEIAAKAPEEIRKAADNPNINDLLHCNQMYRARKEFGAFLKEAGYVEAGNMFLQAADLFRGLCQSSNPKADLLKIAGLQEQSLEKW